MLSEFVGRGITDYSDRVPGERRNHGSPVRFDVTDGYVGICQYDGDTLTDRVLLSPAQLRKLFAFLARTKKKQAKGKG